MDTKLDAAEIKAVDGLVKQIKDNKVNDFIIAIEMNSRMYYSMVSKNGKRLAYRIIKSGTEQV